MGNNQYVKCQCCGQIVHRITAINQWYALPLDKRGKRNSFLCPICATEERSYYAKNESLNGSRKVHDITCAIELESMSDSLKARS